MGLSSVLSRLLDRRRSRRPTLDQLKLLREVMRQAYDVSYYILGDGDKAKQVALRALAGLMDDCDVLKHRMANQGSYRQSVLKNKKVQSRVRSVQLPFELELAVRIFSLTTAYERDERHKATRNDLDVSFCKCVLLASLRRKNAFSAMIGISNWLHTYTKRESISFFDALAQAVPRIREAWEPGNEPFRSYFNGLARAVVAEFDGIVKVDSNGHLTRRSTSEQPQELIAECIHTLTLQEVGRSCLKEPINSAHLRVADVESELRRLHTVLHRPCYTELTGDAGLPVPNEKTGMPEYTTMLKTDGSKTRNAPPLREEELDVMVEEFQSMLEYRRKAPTRILITVDGIRKEAVSTRLGESGHAQLQLNERDKLVEVWACTEDKADVLLAAFFLSLDDVRRTITLQGGQKITFAADYSENDEGFGSFEVNIRYRESNIARRLQLARRRKDRRSQSAPAPWYKQPAFGVLVLCLLVGVGAMIASLSGVGSRFNASIRTKVSGVKNSLVAALRPRPPKDNQPLGYPTYNSGSASVGGTTQAGEVGGASTVKPSLEGMAADEPQHKNTPHTASRGRTLASKNLANRAIPKTKNRQGNTVKASVPLLANIKEIYVENIGIYDSPRLNSKAYSYQIDALKQSGMFQPTTHPGEAAARLVIVSDFESATGDKAQAQLVTVKEGTVIWYGPLLSITRDSDPGVGVNEIKALVDESTKALMLKKETALASVRHKRARKHKRVSPKE